MAVISHSILEAVFTAAATSSGLVIGDSSLVGLVMPASFGQASIEFEASVDNGSTWLPVCDAAGDRIAVVVSATEERWVDLTSVLPLSLFWLRLKTGGLVSKTVKVVTRPA